MGIIENDPDHYGCTVLRVEYDFQRHGGALYVPEGETPDANACVELFQAIDGGVCGFKVISGDTPDMAYLRVSSAPGVRWLRADLRDEKDVAILREMHRYALAMRH